MGGLLPKEVVMTGLTALWLPILVSAVIVFVASAVLHMALPWHRGDYRKVPNEDAARDALRALAIPPGDYMLPCPSSPQEARSPEFAEKLNKGPIVVFTVIPSGSAQMGKNLALWFLYTVVVSFFAAYVAGRALPSGADYLRVFRFAGTTAFIAYSAALWQTAIWYHRSCVTTLKSTVDGLVYALLTAGTFGWLWPR